MGGLQSVVILCVCLSMYVCMYVCVRYVVVHIVHSVCALLRMPITMDTKTLCLLLWLIAVDSFPHDMLSFF